MKTTEEILDSYSDSEIKEMAKNILNLEQSILIDPNSALRRFQNDLKIEGYPRDMIQSISENMVKRYALQKLVDR